MKNTNQRPFERHSETQLSSTIHWGTFDWSSGLPCIFWRIRSRDVDFKDVTATEKSSFCVQRINKIWKLQASETMAANKVASKSNSYQHSGNQSSSTSSSSSTFSIFLCLNDFNSRSSGIPAHKINFKKLCNGVVSSFTMVLVRIYLYEREHARV